MDIGRYWSWTVFWSEIGASISKNFTVLFSPRSRIEFVRNSSFSFRWKLLQSFSESLILASSPRKRNTCWQQRAEGWPAVTWICEKIAKRLHGPPIRKEQTVFGEPCFKPFSRGAIFPPSFFLLPSPLFSTILSHRILFSPFHDSRFQETRLENARTDYARDGWIDRERESRERKPEGGICLIASIQLSRYAPPTTPRPPLHVPTNTR